MLCMLIPVFSDVNWSRLPATTADADSLLSDLMGSVNYGTNVVDKNWNFCAVFN